MHIKSPFWCSLNASITGAQQWHPEDGPLIVDEKSAPMHSLPLLSMLAGSPDSPLSLPRPALRQSLERPEHNLVEARFIIRILQPLLQCPFQLLLPLLHESNQQITCSPTVQPSKLPADSLAKRG
jgi:hypothetical protein